MTTRLGTTQDHFLNDDMVSAQTPKRIVVLAGEASGDVLGAPLIQALRKRYPDAEFRGVVGPLMEAAGCQRMEGIDALSLFGIGEVITELPRLLKLRKSLMQRIVAWQPDVFIGIDAPSFNLGLEKKLKAAGIATVHYVSPTVWAWREGRVKSIRESVNLMLTLFPFEADFYKDHDVDVRFVGHPLADELPLEPDKSAARSALGLDANRPYLAVLPGSRLSEVSKLARPFLESMQWLSRRVGSIGFIVPFANEKVKSAFQGIQQQLGIEELDITFTDGQSHMAMTAADVVLLASGTAALEACLLKRPTVAAYKLAPFTHWLLRGVGMLKVANVTLPNHLSDMTLVPEFIQKQAEADSIGPHLYRWLTRPWSTKAIVAESYRIHQALRLNASEHAAAAISELLEGRS